MRIQTNINGITTTSSFEEGDCYSLVNSRKKNGMLHPVTPRKEEHWLDDYYDIVFVHQFNDYENWIGVIYCDDIKKTKIYHIYNKQNGKLITELDDTVINIEQIGNTLSFITDKRILYALFNENEYIWLGEIPEMQPIKWFNFGFYHTKDYKDEYDISTINNDNFRDMTIGLFNVFRKKMYDALDGCLIDSHLLVFAFRLYDGNYIKQTSPVLLCGNLYEIVNVNFLMFIPIMHLTEGYMGINANKIYLEFDLSYLEKWKDIIKSVDVFISNGLGKCSEANIKDEMNIYDLSNIFDMNYFFLNLMKDDSLMISNIKLNENFYLIDSIPTGTISKYVDDSTQNMNKMFSFPKKSVLGNLDLLIMQEKLPIDTFSHVNITGNTSYTYNNRLHLANIKTFLFNGFNVNYFLLPDKFKGVSCKDRNVTYPIDGTLNMNGGEWIQDIRFNGWGRHLLVTNYVIIAVDLNINGKIHTVYSVSKNNGLYFWLNPYFSYPDTRASKVRFYSSSIYPSDYYNLIAEYDLTANKFINNSYILSTFTDIDKNAKAFILKDNASGWEQITIPPDSPSYSETNKLKVSALNDPFIFPNEQTYLVSDGVILNMASVAIRIAEGQFGQFPLYVFTNKGIYSLQVGSAGVVYATEAAPTSYEVPIIQTINKISTTIICQTPFGVIFTSQRGICIISGQSVELLTGQLRESPKELSIESTPELDDLLKNYGSTIFTEYLKGVDFIIYDPHENEVIVICKELPFNFVMNFDSKQFYLSTEKIDKLVLNTFPELKVIETMNEGLSVKNYAESGAEDAYVSLVTRPLNFGTTDFKKLERMFFRATLYNPVDAVILNYFSLDEVNFRALKGFKVNPETRKDFDMGLFSRTKYRQFIFAFAGTLNEKSEIKYLETEIDKEYDNKKMR